MADIHKTKEQLISELAEVRQLIAKLEILEIKHKRAEEELRRSEEKTREIKESYDRITDNADEVIFRVEAEGGHVIFANPAAERLLGYTQAEWLADNTLAFKIIHPDSVEELRRIIRQINTAKKTIKNAVLGWIAKDGREIIVEYTIVPVTDEKGEVIYFDSIGRDITERKRDEEALRRSELEKAAVLNSMSELVVYQDMNMKVLWANRVATKSVGLAPKQLVGRHCYEIWHQRSEPCVGCPVVRVHETGQPQQTQTTTRDGRQWLVRGYPVRDANGDVVGIVEVVGDITERKRMEEALQESEQNFRALAENSTDAIMIFQIDGTIAYVNRRAAEMTGYSTDELLHTSIRDLAPPDKLDKIMERHQRIHKGESVRRQHEGPLVQKDGESMPAEITVTTTTWKGEPASMVVFRDITERKQAEKREKELQQELYLSSRLASIGQLAAGVAHEINNPLTGVLGFSQRLLRKSTDEKTKEGLEIIHNEALRAAKVVKNLLTFARRREPVKEYSNINDVMQRALELRVYELKTGNIEVVTDLAPSLPQIMVDSYQVQQVFLNIIINAEQVMIEAHGGGKLCIKTKEIKDYIRISFANDGPMIPAE